MPRSLLLSASLVLSLAVSGCATVEIPDVNAYVTLPASGDGYGITTLSRKETRIPKEQWDDVRRRGITLLPDDWAKLKWTILKNCMTNDCRQSVGALDGLFYAIDEALGHLPGP